MSEKERMIKDLVLLEKETKEQLQIIKSKLGHLKSEDDVIQYLLRSLDTFQEYQRKKAEEESNKSKYIREHMLSMNAGVKIDYVEMTKELQLSEDNGIRFLMEHYKNSPTMEKETFNTYLHLRG